jgi:hypothetical protein
MIRMQDAIDIGPRLVVFDERLSSDDTAQHSEADIRSELERRQDDVLRLLDELNEQIEAVIREFAPPSPEAASAA